MKKLQKVAKEARINQFQILDDIIFRWSPREMSGEEVAIEDLQPLFEASRWAPSSNNNQEWHFYFSHKNDRSFKIFLGFLNPGNQKWCKDAGVLLILVSKKVSDYKDYPIKSHSFDVGTAYQNFAIEGIRRNIVVHPMGGFDELKVKQFLNLSEDFQAEIMIAVGKPNASIFDREQQISQRNPIKSFTTHIK